jgi:hypothetical protein
MSFSSYWTVALESVVVSFFPLDNNEKRGKLTITAPSARTRGVFAPKQFIRPPKLIASPDLDEPRGYLSLAKIKEISTIITRQSLLNAASVSPAVPSRMLKTHS